MGEGQGSEAVDGAKTRRERKSAKKEEIAQESRKHGDGNVEAGHRIFNHRP